MHKRGTILAIARAQVGVREKWFRRWGWSNIVKYNDWYVRRHGRGFKRAAWCHIFVSWCAEHAGMHGKIPETAWCPDGLEWFQDQGRATRGGGAMPGDIVYYIRRGSARHVGLVESATRTHVVTIEGNTNTSGAAQGNGVYRLRRRIDGSMWFGHPDYSGTATAHKSARWDGKSYPGSAAFRLGSRHPAVRLLGQRLVAHGYGRYYKIGPGLPMGRADIRACRAFQRAQGWRGKDADGYPGPQTWAKLMAKPAKPARRKRRPSRAKKQRPVVSLRRLRSAFRADSRGKQGHKSYPSGVHIVEKALAAEGLLARRWVDGSGGTMTVEAYRKLQQKYGYRGRAADGIPGSATLARLGAKHGFKVVR